VIASLLFAAMAVIPQQGAEGVVWGQVRSGTTGAPLSYAVVEVVADGFAPIRSETDASGRYVLHDVPPGRRIIRASHIDHASRQFEVIVVSGQRMGLDFELQLRPVKLRGIPVIGTRPGSPGDSRRDTAAVRAGDLGTATVRVLEATPGVAELGLAEAAREVPGHEPVDPSDVLFVRGGSADLKLVLLNGAPVFAPFNIGGLVNSLDTDLYNAATLYLGGAPARYDGGLSYVMDLESRSGRDQQIHGNVAVDMIAAKGIVEGPLFDGASFIFGGRTVHGRGAEALANETLPYTYGDGMGRMDFDLGPDHSLSVTGFWNRESVSLDSLARPSEAAAWGNRAGSARLRGTFGGSDGLITLAIGEFDAQLPVGGLRVLLTEGVSRHMRGTADFGRQVSFGQVHFGASFDRLEFEQRVWPEGLPRDSSLFASSTGGNVAGVYFDASTNPIRRVTLRGGLRADVYSLSPGLRLAPRLSATILMTERVALTLAAGRYSQYVRSTGTPLAIISTPSIAASGEVQSLEVASATHFLAALDQDLGESLRLSLEGFYKSFKGLPSSGGPEAKASGVDLWLRRNGGALNGWFGYSLAWVWSDDDPITASRHVFAGRQLVSAGVSGPVIGKGKFDVRVSYGAGLPFAAVPEPEAASPIIGVGFVDHPAYSVSEPVPSVPTAPDQPYLRVDAQIARTWNAALHGFQFSLTPYVKVLNALNRRDGIFYYYDRGSESQARALAGLPVLPIVGLDWRF
jgi:Carboxypeptidase regulatory-like domain